MTVNQSSQIRYGNFQTGKNEHLLKESLKLEIS